MSDLDLPGPIVAYFKADQRDGEAVAHCFTKQAVVKDEGQNHRGSEAIKAWKTAVSAKYAYTSAPLAVEQTEGWYIVTSRLTGNFPGSPVNLRYLFRLERGKIAELEVKP
jgi:SnoaL-like domain